MEEEAKEKKKKGRTWLKYTLLSLFALLLIITLIFPPIYSKYILRPMIEETFVQVTEDAYHLEFDKLRWNLFRSHLFLDQIRIEVKNDNLENQNIEHLYLDTLILKNIHYWKLIQGEALVKSIELKNLNLKVNLYSEQDSLQKIHTEAVNKSGFISSFQVGEFNLDHLNLQISMDDDSLFNIGKADINIFEVSADSLNYPSVIVLPVFDELRFFAEKIWVKNEDHQLHLNDFVLSENQSTRSAQIDFRQLLFENKKNGNQQVFSEAKISIDSIDWIDRIDNPYIKGGAFTLLLESIENKVQQIDGKRPKELLEELRSSIDNLGMDFEFDSFKLHLNSLEHDHPFGLFKVQDLDYFLKNPLKHQKKFEYANYQLSSSFAAYRHKHLADEFSFDKMHFNEEDSLFVLDGFNYKGGALGESELVFNRLDIEGINPIELLEKNDLKFHSVKLFKPYLRIKKQKVSDGTEQSFPYSIDIANIEVFDGDFEWPEKGFEMHGSHVIIDSLLIPMDSIAPWEEMFQEIEIVSQSVQYQSPMDSVTCFIGNCQLNSRRKKLFFEEIDFSALWSEKKSSMEAHNVLLSGLNWKEIIHDVGYIELDTLQWSSLNLEGSFNGKTNLDTNWKADYNVVCRYLYLPQIDAQVELEIQEKPTQFLLENLAITGNDILFDLEAYEFLQFDQLVFSSAYTSFAQSLDSFLISTENWDLNMLNKKFTAQSVHFKSFSHNELYQSNAEVFLDVDRINLNGLRPFLLLNDKEVYFDTISISKPRLKFNGKRFTQIEYNEQSSSYYRQLRNWIGKYKSIAFKNLHLEQLKLDVNNQYFERRDHIEIEELGLLVDDFYVDYSSFDRMDSFLFYNNLDLEMRGYSQSINNGERLIDLKQANISSLDNRLYFQDFRLLSLGDSIVMPLNLRIKNILFKGLKFQSAYQNPSLYLGSVIINQPEMELKESKLKWSEDQKFNLEEINIYPFFKDQLSSLVIDQFELNQCNVQLPTITKGNHQIFTLNHININVEGVNIDSNNLAFTENKFFYSDDVSIQIPKFSMVTADRFYDLSFNELSLSSRSKSIRFDTIQLRSRYDRKTFSAQLKYQRDQVDLIIPSLIIENIDYREAIFRDRYKAGSASLNQAQLRIFKDKTIAPDTSIFRPMPSQLIQNLGFYLNVDTLFVNDGFIKYEEFTHLMEQNGEVYFDNVQAKITGVSNDNDFIQYGGAMKFDVSGRIMAEANILIHALFPLNSPQQEFIVMANMEPLKAASLNPLLQPLTLMSAKDGQLDAMQMNVSGDNDIGYGVMLLKYNSLKIEVLNKKLKESQLASFLANSILIKKNNVSLFPRKGPIYYERVKYRSFIHYLTHFAIIGAKTSIGIDQRKTARKIKKFEENKN